MFQKRIINKKLTTSYRSKPCVICHSKNLVSGHHIKSKGSGGHDLDINLVALCFKHHEEIHRGLNKFVSKYPVMENILIKKGWLFDENYNKWRNSDAGVS